MPIVIPTERLLAVTRRLFIALMILVALGLGAVAILLPNVESARYVVPIVVITTGIVGGFVGLQRRLTSLTAADLELLARSWIYTCLSPLVGGILALLLYVIFLSGLLTSELLPRFVQDPSPTPPLDWVTRTFKAICLQHGEDYRAYAKLIFWCFVAGFSERFVTNVISGFEGAAIGTLPNVRQESKTHNESPPQ